MSDITRWAAVYAVIGAVVGFFAGHIVGFNAGWRKAKTVLRLLERAKRIGL